MNKNYVPDWKLERYLLGELPKREIEAIAALERDDEELRGRVAALRASNDEILAQYPPALMAEKARAALAGEPGSSVKPARNGKPAFLRKPARARKPLFLWNQKNLSRWAVPAFVCAAALICLPTRVFPPASYNGVDGQGDGDGIRIKGLAPSLEVWRKAGESAEKLAPQAVARAGDIVQLRYIVPKFCYGALISIDGRGVLTVHLSDDSGKAAPLIPGRPIALNNSYQLDDAPDFETFYLITSAYIFDVNSAVEALKIAGYPLDANGEVKSAEKRQITGFTLLKSYDSAGSF